MTITRSRITNARRVTGSIAAANAGKSPETQGNHIKSALPTNKPAMSTTRHTAKKQKDVPTGTNQMTTRSIAKPDVVHIVWTKGGQRSENSLIKYRPVGAPIPRGVAIAKVINTRSTKSAQIMTKDMVKAAKTTSETTRRPGSRVNKTSGREENNSTLSTKRRHQIRLAQQSIDVNIVAPTTLQDTTSGSTAARSSTPSSWPNVPASTGQSHSPTTRSIPSNTLSSVIGDAVGPGNEDPETRVEEDIMDQYMSQVRLTIEVYEHCELLRAAIASPLWGKDLNREIQKQVVRLYLAIDAGRAKDSDEVLEYPLEHDFWTEQVLYNIDVSRAR
jgi:hypothetical protein